MSPLLQPLITLNNPQSPERHTFSSCSHNRAATIFTRLREEVNRVSDTSSIGAILQNVEKLQESKKKTSVIISCDFLKSKIVVL
ncbi:hypothetical protein LR48_Vigan08g086000 [Vigna angularis]|uniref:Uncharacterized protein n=1 Tax=Phaseolus angularis TaxID=3914 RepID=A0A0L9V511_PHAAN|nr:hypothetical protein LR48_Vigan08g086000 [Vigna angularis]